MRRIGSTVEHDLPPDELIERLLTLAADELGARVTLQIFPSTDEAREPADPGTAGRPLAVVGPDGRAYGRLWVDSADGRSPSAAMGESIARVIGQRLGSQAAARAAWDRRVAEVRAVLDEQTLRMRYQPIVALTDGRIVGVEALARFPGSSADVPPERWFADASAIGFGLELELAAVGQALDDLEEMAADLYLAVNVSPETVLSPALSRMLRRRPLDRLVFEITEHAEITDYTLVNRALHPLRRAGVRLAVDDAGAGFASLRHILRMSPDIIKLDRSLTRGIDQDPVLRALTYSIASFASATDAAVVAEGIEEENELDALRFLGVAYGQGFHLCRPDDISVIGAATEDVIDLGDLNRSSAG